MRAIRSFLSWKNCTISVRYSISLGFKKNSVNFTQSGYPSLCNFEVHSFFNQSQVAFLPRCLSNQAPPFVQPSTNLELNMQIEFPNLLLSYYFHSLIFWCFASRIWISFSFLFNSYLFNPKLYFCLKTCQTNHHYFSKPVQTYRDL